MIVPGWERNQASATCAGLWPVSSASFYQRVEDSAAFLGCGADWARIAEDHGAKAEFGDA
jgi:hypothetical protein